MFVEVSEELLDKLSVLSSNELGACESTTVLDEIACDIFTELCGSDIPQPVSIAANAQVKNAAKIFFIIILPFRKIS